MKLTQSVLGITLGLALAVAANPASAQSRDRGDRGPQRHGSSRQAQPARQQVRGPDRVVSRSAVRTSRGPDAFRGGPRHSRDYVRGGYVRSYSPSRYYGSSSRYYASRGYGAVPRHYEQRRRGGVYSGRYYGNRYYRPYYRTYYRPYYRYYPSRFAFGYSWGYPYAFAGYPFYGYGWGWGGHPYGPYGYGSYYNNNGYSEDQGGIRLQMNPKQAQVTVDGYFVGVVDDFDGISQRLELEAGPHKIEITAPGYEPFGIEVNILREQTIKYKGALRPLP
jgi:hypothetical protein